MSEGAGPRLAGVAGWPVAHSLSPRVHGAWLATLGREDVYAAFAVRPETAATAFRALPALGIAGVNVTLPLKETALRAADSRTTLAETVGAANLLTVDAAGMLCADNTDVAGVRYALRAAPPPSAEDRALVLGAGGAARAIVCALIAMGWRRLVIVNRSVERAAALASDARAWSSGAALDARAWEDRHALAREAGLIANATSLGMIGQPPLDLDLASGRGDRVVFDSVYTPLETPLLRAAREQGLAAVDGLDMLIGQAIPSFEAFFGAPPPTSVDARALLSAALRAREARA